MSYKLRWFLIPQASGLVGHYRFLPMTSPMAHVVQHESEQRMGFLNSQDSKRWRRAQKKLGTV